MADFFMGVLNVTVGILLIIFGLINIIFSKVESKRQLKFIKKYYTERNIRIFIILGAYVCIFLGILIIFLTDT